MTCLRITPSPSNRPVESNSPAAWPVTVAVGAKLRGGQTVGRVGDSGSLKGAYLYFEIHKKPRPLNPMEWLRP